eukprot:4385672-Amphidinium_carterae.1
MRRITQKCNMVFARLPHLGQADDRNLQNLASPCFMVCILLGWKLFSKAASGVQGMRPNVEFLMVLAMLGSLVLGKPYDAAMVATL